MPKEERNPASFIAVVAFFLTLLFLIVAIDNKTLRFVFTATLLGSLFVLLLIFLNKRKKATELSNLNAKTSKTSTQYEEGFIIKKQEQTTATPTEKLNPRDEFKTLIRQVLTIIKNQIFSDSVAFYWANEDKRQMVLEDGITELGYNFVKRYNWDDDVLTDVAITGNPKILGDIIAEKDVIKYQSPSVGVKSLLVYPVTYRNKVIGVLLLDSKQTQTFSEDDLKNIALFADLISNLIENYTTKFDLFYSDKVLEVISDSNLTSVEQILNKVQNFAIKILDCTAFAAVLQEDEKWVVKIWQSKIGKYIDVGTPIDLTGSIVGEAITTGRAKIIPSTRTAGKVVRFTENEKINLESSIAVIPINHSFKCYGAMIFEHSKPNFFASYSDLQKLEVLAKIIGVILENENLNELIENYFIYDEATLLMRKNYFLLRLDAEIERKLKHGGFLSLVLLSVDNLDYIRKTYGDEATYSILPEISNIVRERISKFDLAGKLDENLIGVALVETDATEAQLWAEKLRRNISNHEIRFKDKSFSVTITAGVSPWDGDRNAEEFFSRVMNGFLKVKQSAENIVKVF
jgi:diguanylate cyclase (GGDEF)-like protein